MGDLVNSFYLFFFPILPPGIYHPKEGTVASNYLLKKGCGEKKVWDTLGLITKNAKHHSSWNSLTILYHCRFLTVMLFCKFQSPIILTAILIN